MVRSLLLILLMACSLWIQAQIPFSFSYLNAGQDFTHHPVHHISQDQAGQIWIATGRGLVNMNGIRSRMYMIPDSLSTYDTRVMLHNQDGSAWVATAGPLLRLTPEKEFIPHGLAYIRENRIFDMVRDESDKVWFLGAEQVFCLDSLGNVRTWSKGETGLSGVWEIDQHHLNEGIEIVTSTGRVRMTEKGALKVDGSDKTREFDVSSYGYGNKSEQRGYFFDKKQLSLALRGRDDINALQTMTVLRSDLLSVFLDKEGNIWVGTQSEGLYMISQIQVEMVFTQLERKQSDSKISGSDDSKRVILGENGLSLTTGNQVLLSGEISAQWQLPVEEEIHHLKRFKTGWLAASSSSLFYCGDQGGPVLQLSLPGITSLDKAANEQVLICRENRYHYQFESIRLKELFQSVSPVTWLSSNTNWTQEGFSYKGIRSSEGTWVILVHGGIIIKSTEEAREQIGVLSVEGDYLDIVSLDSTTILAAATQGGFLSFKNGEPIFSSFSNSYWSYGPVSAVLMDRDRQKLWILAKQGVVRFDGLDSLGQSTTGYLIPGSDLLVKERTSAAISDNGLDILHKGDVWPISVPSPSMIPGIDLMVTCISVAGAPCVRPWKGVRNFSSDSNAFTFEFSIGSYSFLKSQVLEYQIDGENWLPVEEGSISFYNLPVGEYHLLLRLRSGSTILSEPSEVLAFAVGPPFYQSWWFVFITAIMLVGLIWAGMNLYYGETERKKLEVLVEQRTRDLDHSIKELQQKNQDLEQFAYITSHDLKSPLRGMIGHLQLIEKKYSEQLGVKGRQSMSHAVGEAKRMYEMVNDLLDFASIGSEKLTKRKVTMDYLLKNLIVGMKRQLKEIGGQIEVGPMPVVEVVPGQWETLFRNLIENGLKFNNSTIPTIRISQEKHGEKYYFRVSDNGIGMDDKYQEKAFELYGRLNPEYPGTGIGLAICKKVVERHGGEIWIVSSPDEGTTFHFTVPILDSE